MNIKHFIKNASFDRLLFQKRICFNTYLSNNIFKEKSTRRHSLNPYYILGIVSLFYILNLMILASLNGIILHLSYRWVIWTQKVLIACPKPDSAVGRRHLDSSLDISSPYFVVTWIKCLRPVLHLHKREIWTTSSWMLLTVENSRSENLHNTIKILYFQRNTIKFPLSIMLP